MGNYVMTVKDDAGEGKSHRVNNAETALVLATNLIDAATASGIERTITLEYCEFKSGTSLLVQKWET